ncbi:hypothetical protein SAMN04489761_2807 [Tenacibaculum sp. MAR_2009_124]|uniref:hypothetical protein n=1 Tax=Tenacibaculum sp. MAR_2009_124 TaxID=1250059 RepID=UPI0008966CBC|nr:hypothetical protein [Tenacibaculum sp. MAR_2009_124]SEC37203.1 hypothetical protein SAMN04489761_2807 [Tenacibaculum sp. MAR_2009_124]
MKTEVTKLLKEMLRYLKTRKNLSDKGYLKKAHDEIDGSSGVFSLVVKLANWLDPIELSLSDGDSKELKLRGNEGLDYGSSIKDMEAFFRNCPELNLVFRLEKEVVYFSPDLSEDEQIEIREFVKENRERNATNFYIPVKKQD